MTAEIALLNKEAVALAADSAVTFQTDTGVKILPSANKIFTLSKYHPVGVMIYGNATLMGVPWELLIKMYRQQLGTRSFDTLEQYAEAFLRYLAEADVFFPRSVQDAYVQRNVEAFFSSVVEDITDAVQRTIEDKGGIGEDAVIQITQAVIADVYQRWSALEFPPTLPHGLSERLLERYGETIDDKVKAVFQKLPISQEDRDNLRSVSVSYLLKFVDPGSDAESGLVFAGYGDKEVFPALRSYRVEGVLMEHVLHIADRQHDVAVGGAGIVPFAQSEMVHTFMQGVDPTYQRIIENELVSVLQAFAETATTGSGLKGRAAESYKQALEKVNASVIDRFREQTLKHRHLHYALPAVRVTQILPKDELAAMAESLVNLTVYRRRMSMADETVGGPVDVAVISKGDGFIWIKRKHYFSPELNPQFTANYFR